MKARRVTLIEVGLRDGLQNEAKPISYALKSQLAKRLIACGHREIELGAFVSPQKVPQMADSDRLFRKFLNKSALSSDRLKTPTFSALVPNFKGFEIARDLNVKKIAVVTATSNTFLKKNINATVEQSLVNIRKIVRDAQKSKIEVRAYLSTVFGCPFEGRIKESVVLRLVNRLTDLGVDEISLGDTIGIANPNQVRSLIPKLISATPAKRVALHFHDTRGLALANILESYRAGITRFDCSIGGLGGCPFARGATGNVATEDVAYLFESMGVSTGLDLKRIIATNHWLSKALKRPLPARIAQVPNQPWKP